MLNFHRALLGLVLTIAAMAALFPAVTSAQAGEPVSAEDFARHWPVETGDVGIYAVTLTPDLYRHIHRRDLGDLAAFNSAGDDMAFGPMAWMEPEREPETIWREVDVYSLPAARRGASGTRHEGVAVDVERSPDGRLRIRAESAPISQAPAGDLLIDTGLDPEEGQRVRALTFELDPEPDAVSFQLRVDASADLETWRTVVSRAGLLRVRQGDQVLERRRVELRGVSERYLRVRRLGEGTMPITGLRAETLDAAAPDPAPLETWEVESHGSDDGAFLYRLPGRIPVRAVGVRPADENSVVAAKIFSREKDDDPWRYRAHHSGFRLRAAGGAETLELDSEPVSLGSTRRDRQWRVEVRGASSPPTLVFHYRPERWLLLSKGEAPYVVAAGGRRAAGDRATLQALIKPLRAQYGEDWRPPTVELGDSFVVSGEAATREPPQERWSEVILWVLLVASVATIVMMVMRLVKEGSPEPQP